MIFFAHCLLFDFWMWWWKRDTCSLSFASTCRPQCVCKMCCMTQHLSMTLGVSDFIPGLPDSLLIQWGAVALKAFALGQLIIFAECVCSTLYLLVCGSVSIMQQAVSASPSSISDPPYCPVWESNYSKLSLVFVSIAFAQNDYCGII